MYTPIIAPADLKTALYTEIIDEITRNDVSIVTTAIANATAEVQIYLSRYDRKQLFGSITGNTPPTFFDPYLTGLVKDIAMWQLITLANPNISYDMVRTRYEDAVTALKMIQSGKSNPEWPYLDTSTSTPPPQGDGVTIFANPKRHNY